MSIIPPRIYLQDSCLKHRYVRTKDMSDVYERPERLRAINIGIASLYAHLEEFNSPSPSHNAADAETKSQGKGVQTNGRLDRPPLTIVRSAATIDMRVHRAALAVHSGEDEDGEGWCLADEIDELCVQTVENIQKTGSEIPPHWEQDLYRTCFLLIAF
jgi:histone deacetylase HOS3